MWLERRWDKPFVNSKQRSNKEERQGVCQVTLDLTCCGLSCILVSSSGALKISFALLQKGFQIQFEQHQANISFYLCRMQVGRNDSLHCKSNGKGLLPASTEQSKYHERD